MLGRHVDLEHSLCSVPLDDLGVGLGEVLARRRPCVGARDALEVGLEVDLVAGDAADLVAADEAEHMAALLHVAHS